MVNVIRCNTLLVGAVLKVIVLVPSVILTLPALVFFAILMVITVPIGNSSANRKSNLALAVLVLLTVVQFPVFAAAPGGEIGPVDLIGLTPPVAAITLPVVGINCSAIPVTVKVVSTVKAVTFTTAVPAAFNVTV